MKSKLGMTSKIIAIENLKQVSYSTRIKFDKQWKNLIIPRFHWNNGTKQTIE